MAKAVLLRVLEGTSDANIRFSELRDLLSRLGFSERAEAATTFSRATASPKS